MNREDRDQSTVVDQLGFDYRAIFQTAADGILLVGPDGRIVDANPECARQFGYREEELLGMVVHDLVPDHAVARHKGHHERFLEKPTGRPMGMGMELSGRRKDGSEFPVEISLSVYMAGESMITVCIVRDMTERQQLRALSLDAIHGAERERRRIAQELHDDTAQLLSSLLVRLRLLEQEPDSERRAAAAEELREQVRDAAEGVRRIARGLRPPALEDAGVVTALRGHAQEFFERTEVSWEIDADAVDHILDENQKLVLYRVAQEAMSNVIRHAEASHLSIRLEDRGHSVVTTIADDGNGYDVEKVRSARGLGLPGMRERALGIGGRIDFHSTLGEGSTIVLSLPVDNETSDA